MTTKKRNFIFGLAIRILYIILSIPLVLHIPGNSGVPYDSTKYFFTLGLVGMGIVAITIDKIRLQAPPLKKQKSPVVLKLSDWLVPIISFILFMIILFYIIEWPILAWALFLLYIAINEIYLFKRSRRSLP